ncbi:TRAP transporter substrate-binding protein [Azospirillum oleiclasticum]|nr:TRAP transporter substrate-binding protein [Azospirillum oleiclasticum]
MKMLKRFLPLALSTVTLAAVTLAAAVVPAEAATRLRFGYEAPRSDSQHVASERFKELLAAKTGNELQLQLFPEGTLGNAQALINGTRGGTIDLELSGSSNFSGLEPLLNVLDTPFTFKDEAHAYRFLDGEGGQKLLDALEKHNLKGLAYWDNGFRMITNTKRPVRTPDDVKGLKIRTTASAVHIEAFKLLGANPAPMPLAELYTALETGAMDAQEHPLGVLWSVKLYEVQKHLTLSRHAYSPLILVMNKPKFDSLPPAQQKAMIEAAREAGAYQRQLNAQNVAMIVEGVKKAGMQVVETIDPQPFARITAPARQFIINKFGGEDIFKQIDTVRDVP